MASKKVLKILDEVDELKTDKDLKLLRHYLIKLLGEKCSHMYYGNHGNGPTYSQGAISKGRCAICKEKVYAVEKEYQEILEGRDLKE